MYTYDTKEKITGQYNNLYVYRSDSTFYFLSLHSLIQKEKLTSRSLVKNIINSPTFDKNEEMIQPCITDGQSKMHNK